MTQGGIKLGKIIAVVSGKGGTGKTSFTANVGLALAAQIPNSVLVDSLEAAADWVKQNAREGDLVITLGCGDVYKLAKKLVKRLEGGK